MVIEHDAKDIERFMSYVEKLDCGCWYWTGARSRGKGNKKWYGSFRVKGKTVRAHTFSHDVVGQKVCPPGHHRDHVVCNFSMCVNFEHVEAVTREVNQQRKVARRKRTVEMAVPVLGHHG